MTTKKILQRELKGKKLILEILEAKKKFKEETGEDFIIPHWLIKRSDN